MDLTRTEKALKEIQELDPVIKDADFDPFDTHSLDSTGDDIIASLESVLKSGSFMEDDLVTRFRNEEISKDDFSNSVFDELGKQFEDNDIHTYRETRSHLTIENQANFIATQAALTGMNVLDFYVDGTSEIVKPLEKVQHQEQDVFTQPEIQREAQSEEDKFVEENVIEDTPVYIREDVESVSQVEEVYLDEKPQNVVLSQSSELKLTNNQLSVEEENIQFTTEKGIVKETLIEEEILEVPEEQPVSEARDKQPVIVEEIFDVQEDEPVEEDFTSIQYEEDAKIANEEVENNLVRTESTQIQTEDNPAMKNQRLLDDVDDDFNMGDFEIDNEVDSSIYDLSDLKVQRVDTIHI